MKSEKACCNRRLSAAFAVIMILAAPLCAADGEAEKERVSEREETIVIAGLPTRGWPILPANDTEFKFKHAETGIVMAFRWSTLEESERKRVMKLFGLEVKGDRLVFGNKLTGMRFKMESGKSIEGLPIPERDQRGQKAIRTCDAPLMMLPEREIKSTEPIECYESDFFKPREIYERMLLERPPGNNDAAAHLEYANKAASMALYKEALDPLKIAEIIDPRTEERNKEFRLRLITEAARKQAQDLYDQMLRARMCGEFFTALDILERLERNFPNSELKSRWDGLRAEIEEGTKLELNKRVIQMSYAIASDLIQQRLGKKTKVDEKGNIVASIPGKQVTTRQGHIFRGTLVNPDATGDLVIKTGETTLTIAGKDVMAVQDVDLSVGAREISPGYDELKTFVTDAGSPTGLKLQMCARISQLLKVPEAKVREIFDARLARDARYEDGQVTMTKTFISIHDAYYGVGSWLRDGVRPAPYVQIGPAQPRNNGRNGGASGANQAPTEGPDETDDPAVWWKFQNSETQLAVLRAMAGEKVFKIKQETKVACPGCGNTGLIPILAPGGNIVNQRCPTCRGIGVLFRIGYN